MTISFGIFPIIGIVLAAVLLAVHRLWLRMKCSPRSTQRFIKLAVAASLLVTFVHPVRVVPNETRKSVHATSVSTRHAVEPQSVGAQITDLMQTNLTSEVKTNDVASYQSMPEEHTNIVLLIYIIGVGGVLSYILFQLGWMLRVRLHNRLIERKDNVSIYESELSTPFSFGQNIFMPASLDQDMKQYVLKHEHSHLRHRHFMWLCLMEMIIAVQWFNPFVWMLLNELKLHQEMEVDSELMAEGVDREAYQMSLLRVCSNSGRWVLMQTAFGASPLKYRILFMNSSVSKQTSRKRFFAAFILLLLLAGTSIAISCRTEKEKSPLDGCWRTDWIRNSDDKYEHVVSLYNNKFWGNNMMINFSWFERYKEVNMRYNFSGEQQIYSDGKLHTAKGDTLRITWLDDDNVQEEWNRNPDQVELVNGAKITEQRHRVKPDKGAMRILRAMYTAGEDRSHRISGVWQWDNDTTPDIDHFFVVNGDIFFTMSWFYSDKKYLRRGAGGWSGDFRWISENAIFLSDRTAAVKWKDNDHITIYTPREEYEDIVSYHRIEALPEDLHLLLTAAFPQE